MEGESERDRQQLQRTRRIVKPKQPLAGGKHFALEEITIRSAIDSNDRVPFPFQILYAHHLSCQAS